MAEVDNNVVKGNEDTTGAGNVKTEESVEDLKAQIQKLMADNAKLKVASDKNASQAADFKKKYNASLSEAERLAQEKAEKEAEREERYQALERELTINKVEKSYLAMGYTSDEANRMAIAETDNDFDAKVKIMSEVEGRKKKEYEAEWLKNRPPVNAGTGDDSSLKKSEMTQEQFDSMGYKELLKFQEENPEEYNKFVEKQKG